MVSLAVEEEEDMWMKIWGKTLGPLVAPHLAPEELENMVVSTRGHGRTAKEAFG